MTASFERILNILVVAPWLPYPPDTGGPIRHFQLYSRLGRRHRLTWVSSVSAASAAHVQGALGFCERVIALPNSEAVELPTKGWPNLLMRAVAHLHWERLFVFCFDYVRAFDLVWRRATPERLAVIDQVMCSSHFDALICETIGAVELAPRTRRIPKVVSLFDIQSELFRRLRGVAPGTAGDRLFYLPELFKIRWYESRHYRDFDAAITVSERDRSLLARLARGLRTEVVPNGVEVDAFKPDTSAERQNCLIFVGHFGYAPNADAAYYFCQQILPRIRAAVGEVTFLAVGRDPPSDLGSYAGVQVVSSPPDVRPYLAQASVVVIPVRAGSGTRIKILEAMAMGKAIVSTSVGAEGLDVVNGHHIVLADGPDRFARAVTELLADAGLRARLGAAARQLVEARYDWSTQAAKLQDFIERLSREHHTW